MSPDLLSVTVRAAALVCLFQAAGATFFIALFADELTTGRAVIIRLGLLAALCAAPLLLAHAALEAANMAGEYGGLSNAGLQRLAWFSADGAAHLLQSTAMLCAAAGLCMARNAPHVRGSRAIAMAIAGATLAPLSFVLAGHTSVHSLRWLLAPLLAAHVLIVAGWFGSMLPLLIVLRRESLVTAARVLRRFSAYAIRLVPLILVAGVGMACILLPRLEELYEPYGQLLLAKLAAFVLLMSLAALNRSRFVPALEGKDQDAAERAALALRRSLLAEFLLLVTALALTATLTSFFSPDQ